MWFECPINEETGELAISKKKSEKDMGPGHGYSEISRILIFRLFWARLWRVFENVLSLQGDSSKDRGFPMISCTISCHNMHYASLIESNDTCFAQNFNKSLSPPLFPTTIPTPIIAPPPQPHIPTHSNMCAAVTYEEFQTPPWPPLTPTPCPQPPVPGPAPHILIIFA